MASEASGAAPFDRTPEARYRRDASFRQIVDMLEAHIHANTFTPTELREASLLAAVHHSYRSIPNMAGYTMTHEKAAECWATAEELYREISKDQRP